MNWLKSLENVFGMGVYLPVKTVCASPYISYALNGTSRVVISYMTQPRDQISDFES